MDTTLLAVLVEHHNNDDHAQNGWMPHVYNACIKHGKDRCDVDIAKENIIGRIKTFHKHYEIITKMLAQSGFGWDWVKNMVSVDSDKVWSRYVEANKDACAYRNKTNEPLPMPKVTPPTEILDALKKIPNLEGSDMPRAYGKLIVDERLFEALMALPEELRKPWLLTLD
ncbi:hypothetical protein VPH35_136005 [Triticum aestivum]|uniref:Myb/SANT-like domain-containing protein n=1 Tax=Aegilops tauschii TaxID=37682 RepID=M8CI41_AEGTA